MQQRHHVHLRSEAEETVLDPDPPEALEALKEALARPRDERTLALRRVAARWPLCLEAWARLGEHAADPVESYAYFRVGYHRGLDRLRKGGWRGTGLVRWRHEQNRGFLRSLYGLGKAAEAIGEHDEAARCAEFLRSLDPDWPPAEFSEEVGREHADG
ncbi:MAG: hypothetical protein KatS3mg008_0229 [Acidimicrobiales bacterium]|nr:MAG: hypothetical protein KatS3mg008_0229 [Acidimicrobiales bacterium]